MTRTHLTVLKQAAASYPTHAVFKVPQLAGPDTDEVKEWRSISYAQFHADVEAYARYWLRVLSNDGLAPSSVVALWLGGMTYQDVLHIYGVALAGYTPQLFSLRLPNPDVVNELLQKANAKALIYDLSYSSAAPTFTVPTHPAVTPVLADSEYIELCPHVPGAEDDVAMIFHTSGSTSGSPKLVRCTYRWLDAVVSKMEHASRPSNPTRQDVTVWLGSMCHIGQTCMLIGSLLHGSATVQPTKIAFSADELVDMITRCKLNRLNQFATFLAMNLKVAQRDPKLLGLMRNLDEVLYSGLMLPAEQEKFAYDNGLKLKNLFGNTECGAMMLSIGGKGPDARFLRPIEGTRYGFFPLDSNADANTPVNVNAQLYELVILSESGDCPDVALRAADGHYHTGDLFQRVAADTYVFRGRDDDWIKSENSLRCDTKAIEDNVRATCADLIADCIVVGNGRPSPALFVEPKNPDANPDALKGAILRKTRHFHARRYLHERITSAQCIFIVAPGTLPRTATKGNIRRRAVEERFQRELDVAYGVAS